MRVYFPTNVSDFTKEQCEKYLASYPNSLKSEIVRDRLKILCSQQDNSPNISVEDDLYWEKHHSSKAELKSYQNKFPNGKHIEECCALISKMENPSATEKDTGSVNTSKTHPSDKQDGWEVFFKLILCAGAIALVFLAAYKWNWIGVSFAGPLAYVACRSIWKEL